MSFSVTAVSHSATPATAPGPTARAIPSYVPHSIHKQTVCSTFFQYGQCYDGDMCSFAHYLDELDEATQLQLVTMCGGYEHLPAHFVVNAHLAGTHVAPAWQDSPSPYSEGSRGKRIRREVPALRSPFQGQTTTGSSGATDSGASSTSSTSPRPQGTTGVPVDLDAHLPQRCRYPHAAPGTYYDYLNVKRSCDANGIAEAYRQWRVSGYKKARNIDQAKADYMDRLIVEAKNVLGNDQMRQEYDRHLPETPTSLLKVPPAATVPQQKVPEAEGRFDTLQVPPMFDNIWR